MCDERTRHSGTSIIHFYLHLLYMTTCIIHSPDDKCPLAPLASRAASVDTPTPSPYATDSRSFQLPITMPWHHGSNRQIQRLNSECEQWKRRAEAAMSAVCHLHIQSVNPTVDGSSLSSFFRLKCQPSVATHLPLAVSVSPNQ